MLCPLMGRIKHRTGHKDKTLQRTLNKQKVPILRPWNKKK